MGRNFYNNYMKQNSPTRNKEEKKRLCRLAIGFIGWKLDHNDTSTVFVRWSVPIFRRHHGTNGLYKMKSI